MTVEDGASFEIAALLEAYRSGATDAVAMVELAYERIASWCDDAVWISVVARDEALAAAAALPVDEAGKPDLTGLPLYGIPFAVKDNIDVSGLPTTAACAAFAYRPERSATLVEALLAAGAILIGKNNLDQFATGLSGMRSPYGTPRNAVSAAHVPGGSSSGSASAVSAGLVSFAIGTDTAGSGRVPAALQSIVGIKPSRGMVSTAGLVPACRSLDCPSVFALTVDDAARVLSVIVGPDDSDPWSRSFPASIRTPPRAGLDGVILGVPASAQMAWTDEALAVAWEGLLGRLASRGARLVEIDIAPLLAAGSLLYGGPWIAERWAGLAAFVAEHDDALHPVTRDVLAPGADITGAAVFHGLTRLEELRALSGSALAGVDALLAPTTTAVFTLEQMAADPIARNAALGRFSTFTNLLDMAAVAIPSGITSSGLPFGVTVHAAAGSDPDLVRLARAIEDASPRTLGATGWRPVPASSTSAAADTASVGDPGAAPTLELAVVGAHLEGLPLHDDLTVTGATLVARTFTAPEYRLFELARSTPPKPGLARVRAGGRSIEVEVYAVPLASVGGFLATIPAPLGIGTVELVDGSRVHGFVCEAIGLEDARDVTEFGGWRAYLADARAK
ncbi:allophanate hydrolase [Demequina sp.]|uniref:allophanate hydrolase n=1 Tax=Demequina sp. TaxID=2050685 RepID=UPI0025FEA1BD|nr:allophanate hydrolase [Demequina sp.]